MKVTYQGVQKEYPAGIRLVDLAREHQQEYENDIVLAMVNGSLQELHKLIKKDAQVRFVTTADKPGISAYERTAVLMLLKAVYHIAGHKNIKKAVVDFSVTDGLFIRLKGNVTVDDAFAGQVKSYMEELREKNFPILKRSIHTNDAIELFARHGMYDKERLFQYRRVSRVNIYSLDGFEDYYYGYMVPNTGYIKYFDVKAYKGGLVLVLPAHRHPKRADVFLPQEKLFDTLKEAADWGESMNVSTVADLNDQIVNGDIGELILMQEALQEKKLGEIAEEIKSRGDCHFVMIAGPSSSGKTTFSHRLSIQLRAHGLTPHPIAMDNYFVDREKTPRDERGNYDFEALGAMDVERFNEDIYRLSRGEEVELPTFNFKTGKREYLGNVKKLNKNDILVIEGIHGLNPKMSESLSNDNKYKIYISALTQLNIDEHNRIPTTDGRLLRRMIRDARTRGASASKTISMWYSVRRGEDKNIFPFQEEADAMFNSALIYELAVLKPYAERLLFGVSRDSDEYVEAKRLLKFLDYFLTLETDAIPKNSLLREFIGGSCFNV